MIKGDRVFYRNETGPGETAGTIIEVKDNQYRVTWDNGYTFKGFYSPSDLTEVLGDKHTYPKGIIGEAIKQAVKMIRGA